MDVGVEPASPASPALADGLFIIAPEANHNSQVVSFSDRRAISLNTHDFFLRFNNFLECIM